jgi:hypothetical protein
VSVGAPIAQERSALSSHENTKSSGRENIADMRLATLTRQG